MDKGNRLTIADLARRLDLSPAAASYALNNRPGVSQQTRDKVLNLARELDWYPSSSARALSQSRTGSIGVVLSRNPEMIGTEPYYMQIIAGVEQVLLIEDMSLTLRMVSPQSGADLAIYSRWAAERRVDGVILFDEQVDDPRLPLLERLGLPAVLQGGPTNSPTIRAVGTDDEAVGRMIVDTFAALGHKRLTYLTGPLQMMHERMRVRVITAQAQHHGLETEIIEGDYTMDHAHALISKHLRKNNRPTAITCSNDLMSLATLQVAEEAGLNIPDDLSLISWDDSLLCSVSKPGITAVNRHPMEYGTRTAQALMHFIRGTEGTCDDLSPSELVTRGTTGPAPA